jgi:hypothetical protein
VYLKKINDIFFKSYDWQRTPLSEHCQRANAAQAKGLSAILHGEKRFDL